MNHMFHTKLNKLAVLTSLLTLAFLISSCAADNAENISNNPELILKSNNQTDAQNQNAGSIVESNETSASETRSETAPKAAPKTAPGTFGAEGAAADQELTLEDMLNYAIQDEYLAHAEYQYIIDTFGTQNPFSNIIKAEETHISMLQPLFEQYNTSIPEDLAGEYLILPASVSEALQTGVTAEINNIAMYDTFLAQDLPDDIRLVFEDLMAASEKHLEAFQKPRGRV
jgi:hypothetical protein